MKFKLRKKIFGLFLIFINFSLISRIVFLIEQIYFNRPYTCESGTYCSAIISSSVGLAFLLLASILNIYNWVSFTLSLKSYDEKTMQK